MLRLRTRYIASLGLIVIGFNLLHIFAKRIEHVAEPSVVFANVMAMMVDILVFEFNFSANMPYDDDAEDDPGSIMRYFLARNIIFEVDVSVTTYFVLLILMYELLGSRIIA